jgi:hypothetical protein
MVVEEGEHAGAGIPEPGNKAGSFLQDSLFAGGPGKGHS